jgi:hypothetical protein
MLRKLIVLAITGAVAKKAFDMYTEKGSASGGMLGDGDRASPAKKMWRSSTASLGNAATSPSANWSGNSDMSGSSASSGTSGTSGNSGSSGNSSKSGNTGESQQSDRPTAS